MRAADVIVKADSLLFESFVDGEAVDISATDYSFSRPTRAIYVGGAGNIVLALLSGVQLTFTAVPVGTVLKVGAIKIVRTNTTATALIGLH